MFASSALVRLRRGLICRVLLACCVVSLVMDPHFNFSALKPVLLAEGVFSSVCHSSASETATLHNDSAQSVSSEQYCNRQLSLLNSLFIAYHHTTLQQLC